MTTPATLGATAARTWIDACEAVDRFLPEPQNPFSRSSFEGRSWSANFCIVVDQHFADDEAEQRAERFFGC